MNKEERIQNFKNLIYNHDNTFNGSFLRNLIVRKDEFMNYLINDGFFDAPASTKYHGAYEGGLYDHSAAVYKQLRDLTVKNNLKWKRPESPFIIGMFHDLCKYDQYLKVFDETRDIETRDINETAITIKSTGGFHYMHNRNTTLTGHGSKSVMLLSQFINLTEEELLCIRYHMGAYEKDEWAEFDMAIRKYPNVLWTHQADQLASKIDDV